MVAVVDEPEGGANAKSWTVPVSATICGLPPALSLIETLPEALPPAVGAKSTATVQADPAATGAAVVHVVPELAMANGPVELSAVKVRRALPVLVTVTDCAALVLPDICAGKVREFVDKLTVGPVMVSVPAT
jgi:hypothetical protein